MAQEVAAPGSKVASVLLPAAAAPVVPPPPAAEKGYRAAPRPGEPSADADPIPVPSRALGLPNGTVLARGGDPTARSRPAPAFVPPPPTPQDLGPPQGVAPVGGEGGGEAKAAWLAKQAAAAPTPVGAGPASAPAAPAAAPGNGADLPPWGGELLDLAAACNQGVGYACDALQSEDKDKLEWLATRDVVQPVGGVPAPVAGLDVIKRLRGGWRVVRGQGRYAPARAVPSRGGRVAAAASAIEEEAAARLAFLAKQGVPAWGYVGRAFTDDLPSPPPPAGASREEQAKLAWLANQGRDSKQAAAAGAASAAASAKASFLAKKNARNALSQGAAAKAAWLSEQEVPWWELALSKKFEHGSSM